MKYVCKYCVDEDKENLFPHKNTLCCRHWCERGDIFWTYSHKVKDDYCTHDDVGPGHVQHKQDKKYEQREKIIDAHRRGELPKHMYTPSVVDGKPTLKPSTLKQYGA